MVEREVVKENCFYLCCYPPAGLKWVFPEMETTSDCSLYPVYHESFLSVSLYLSLCEKQKEINNILFSFSNKSCKTESAWLLELRISLDLDKGIN